MWIFSCGHVQDVCVTLPNVYSASENPCHGIILAWFPTASVLCTWMQSLRGKASTYLTSKIKISQWSKARKAVVFSCHFSFPLFEGRHPLLSDTFFGSCGSGHLRDLALPARSSQRSQDSETAARAWHGEGLGIEADGFHCVHLRQKEKIWFWEAWEA